MIATDWNNRTEVSHIVSDIIILVWKKMESGGGVSRRVESTSQRGSAELPGGQLPLSGGQTPTPRQIQPWLHVKV